MPLFETVITYGAKLLNADWQSQRAFSLNHEGTFGYQEDMISWFWLAERAASACNAVGFLPETSFEKKKKKSETQRF